jgi:hypothetical protein
MFMTLPGFPAEKMDILQTLGNTVLLTFNFLPGKVGRKWAESQTLGITVFMAFPEACSAKSQTVDTKGLMIFPNPPPYGGYIPHLESAVITP